MSLGMNTHYTLGRAGHGGVTLTRREAAALLPRRERCIVAAQGLRCYRLTGGLYLTVRAS